MTTTDTEALTERIEERLHDCMFTAVVQEPDGEMTTYVDAPLAEVVRIVEAEVRKAKAEAWDEGCEAFEIAHKCDNFEPWGHLRGNPYRQEQNNE